MVKWLNSKNVNPSEINLRACIPQSVYRRAMGLGGVRFQARARDVSLLHSVQNGSGTHPSPIQWVLWALSPRGKAPGT
jgi:hypothetical protein